MSKNITIKDILTDDQIDKALAILEDGRIPVHKKAHHLEKEVTLPALPHINKVTGQENNARYFAYMIMAVYLQSPKE